MITTLLWDHDGVLVDTEHLYYQATREVMATVGATLTEALYRQHFLVESRGAWHLAEARGVDAAGVARLKALRDARYVELLSTGDRVIPGVRELLTALSPRFRMAIVTSSHRAHFDVLHRESGLPSFFSFVLTREDYAESKPHPEPYLAAVARFGARPEECLVIEDSRRGLLSARAAGLRCWVLPSPLTAQSSFDEADRRFSSLAELSAALTSEAQDAPEVRR
ncbi:HAD family phosphatase [Aggregicoccus sp. 17bor-14]|uniref:HAD family hydrolase n=1 Tax=Myxococcaceae TaxID=31 RepID=UPI00129CAFB0|nr:MULTISPECIES: HAD family phosphatase [Myxococcaceae]MBF5043306.1 HAD family phosphatase [Simulacricoccus sp. 17bor-14]MRI89065.1 HAD family phosphatase [Aggregicoccus sp. 17bor-14]